MTSTLVSAPLELSGITVTFGGITALSDVGLTVRQGAVHGVIGPNGAGKTTLFNVACGFVRPDSGRIVREGRELDKLQPHDLAGLGIARTLQGLALFDRITVLENVMVGADRHARTGFLGSMLALPRAGREERALRDRAREVLAGLKVEQYADRYPPSLPYPVRKRVALARALAAEPSLLLLDEPASGLSSAEMDELGDLVAGLTDTMAVMLVEHHMDLVMRICDEITVLDFGAVIAHGQPGRRPDRPGGARGVPRRRGPPRRARGSLTCWSSATSRPATDRSAPCTRSRSAPVPVRSPPCSVPTAPARPPCCGRSPDCTGRDAGAVELAGRELGRTPADRMPGLGMVHVPEGRGVITELTVEENLRLGGMAAGGRVKPGDLTRVYDLFPVLSDRSNALAHTLSGGERQMLVIGRALMSEPKLLLLDEPSLGLAPRIVAQIFDLLRGLVSDHGLSVLLVEQNARSALSVADHGVVLNLGEVVADDRADVLAADDQLRHAYLGF